MRVPRLTPGRHGKVDLPENTSIMEFKRICSNIIERCGTAMCHKGYDNKRQDGNVIKLCIKNNCTCSNGTAVDGEECTGNGMEKCKSCRKNVKLVLDDKEITTDFVLISGKTGRLCQEVNVTTCNEKLIRSGGYHQIGENLCKENICKCMNGIRAKGKDCLEHGSHKCVDCNSSYHLIKSKDKCIKNKCYCKNGEAVSDNACQDNNNQHCVKCDSYYHLDKSTRTCKPNQCFCRHGNAVPSEECPIHGKENCQTCNAYHTSKVDHIFGLKTCFKNNCFCQNGKVGRFEYECPENNSEKCEECHEGFKHINNVCVKNMCFCDHGIAEKTSDCPLDGLHRCVACDENYHLTTYYKAYELVDYSRICEKNDPDQCCICFGR